MSPEQAQGFKVDARTDIWSLGGVLYEMLAGRRPFEGVTQSHLIVSILEKKPPPIGAEATGIPEACELSPGGLPKRSLRMISMLRVRCSARSRALQRPAQ